MTVPAIPFLLSSAIAEMSEGLPNWVSTCAPLVGGPPFWCSGLAGKSNNPTVTCPEIDGNAITTGGGTTVSGSTVATAHGGSGGYTFSWAYVSGNTAIVGGGNSSGGFSANQHVAGNGSSSAIWQVSVTDSNGHTGSAQFAINFSWENNN